MVYSGFTNDDRNREEADENIREAIQLYFENLVDKGQPIPAEKFETLLVAVRAGCPVFLDASVSKH